MMIFGLRFIKILYIFLNCLLLFESNAYGRQFNENDELETLKCKDTSITTTELRVECDDLTCADCLVTFKLVNLMTGGVMDEKNLTTTGSILYAYNFTQLDCLVYGLNVTLSKQDSHESSIVVPEKVIFPEPIVVQTNVQYDHRNERFFFIANVRNIWKNCANAKLSVELKRPSNCTATLEADSVTVLSRPDYNLTNGQDFSVNISSLDHTLPYLTRYSIDVSVTIIFSPTNNKTLSQKAFQQTDAAPFNIKDFRWTTSTIEFSWERPKDCVGDYYVSCEGDVKTNATLNETLKTGKCQGLNADNLHIVTAFHSNYKSYPINIITDVVPIAFVSVSLRPYSLNLTIQTGPITSYKSLRLCYAMASQSLDELVKCVDVNQFDWESLRGSRKFSNEEMKYSTRYRFFMQTTGSNDNVANSTSLNATTDLDFFQFNPEIPQNPKSNESHIYVTLKPENLPGDHYGNLTIVCTRVDRVDRVVGICEHNEYCECYCKNLIAGTEYSIELLNSKQGFNSTSTKLSNIFTHVGKPNLTSLSIDPSLNVRFVFRYAGNYLYHQFCYKINSAVDLYKWSCYNISNTTTSFNGAENNITYGTNYLFRIRTHGASNSFKNSDDFPAPSTLDVVKLDSKNYLNVSTDTTLGIIFDNAYLPNPYFERLYIRCFTLDNETGSNPVYCTELAGFRTNCQCNSLSPATEYRIRIYTAAQEFQDRVFNLPETIFTRPKQIVTWDLKDRKETSFEIEILLPDSKTSGTIVLLTKSQTLGSEDAKINTERMCRLGVQSTNCKIDGNKIIYTYTALDPGSLYRATAWTFYQDKNNEYRSEQTSKVFWTDVDLPDFKNFHLESGRLRVNYVFPKASFINMTFVLLEKDTNSKTYSFFDEFVYFRGAAAQNYSQHTIEFSKKISTKVGVKYKVQYVMEKDSIDVLKKGEFDQVFVVPFASYLIAIIVIACVIVIILPIMGVLYFRSRPSHKTLIRPENLSKTLKEWDQNQNAGCELEWKELHEISEKNITIKGHKEVGKEPNNIYKNRYKDILPYEHSRVKLTTTNDRDVTETDNYISDDYINACYIPGLRSDMKYIACQAPLESTIEDFWRMVWEKYVGVIIMLANIYESEPKNVDEDPLIKGKKKKKCDLYWPCKPGAHLYGDIKVTLTNEYEQQDYVVRKMIIEADDIKQYVTHYQFRVWPDKKFPKKESLLKFILDIRKNVTNYENKGPTVVHCSAGIGRTGTYLAIEPLMTLIENKKPVDIFNRVVEMRDYRGKMVQNSVQYRFIYEFLAFYYEKLNEKKNKGDSFDKQLELNEI